MGQTPLTEHRKKRRSTTNGPRPVLQSTNPQTTTDENSPGTIPTSTPLTKPPDFQTFSQLHPFTPPPANTINTNNPFSPSFDFTTVDPSLTANLTNNLPQHDSNATISSYDPTFSMPTPCEQQPTPGAASASGSARSDPEKDPFLSLLEQLAENESSQGGPSELDFFLSGQG
jgi:hypothetical protein